MFVQHVRRVRPEVFCLLWGSGLHGKVPIGAHGNQGWHIDGLRDRSHDEDVIYGNDPGKRLPARPGRCSIAGNEHKFRTEKNAALRTFGRYVASRCYNTRIFTSSFRLEARNAEYANDYSIMFGGWQLGFVDRGKHIHGQLRGGLGRSGALAKLRKRHRSAVWYAAYPDGMTAMIRAASSGHTATVKALAGTHGANVDAVNVNGWTALMLAAKYGHTDIVNALAGTHGASVDAVDEDGQTALMYAAMNGHEDTVNALIWTHGASTEALREL